MKYSIAILSLLTIFSTTFLTVTARADQKATLTCTGKNIILQERSPYLGDDPNFLKLSQSLYVLKLIDSNDNESKDTAFFLDVEVEEEKENQTTYLVATNGAGGFFQLELGKFKDIGDGNLIRESTLGKISYSHGPLKGNNEEVSCIRE